MAEETKPTNDRKIADVKAELDAKAKQDAEDVAKEATYKEKLAEQNFQLMTAGTRKMYDDLVKSGVLDINDAKNSSTFADFADLGIVLSIRPSSFKLNTAGSYSKDDVYKPTNFLPFNVALTSHRSEMNGAVKMPVREFLAMAKVMNGFIVENKDQLAYSVAIEEEMNSRKTMTSGSELLDAF